DAFQQLRLHGDDHGVEVREHLFLGVSGRPCADGLRVLARRPIRIDDQDLVRLQTVIVRGPRPDERAAHPAPPAARQTRIRASTWSVHASPAVSNMAAETASEADFPAHTM